uniref:Protein kinase domain-containing protein n=1 Tax=Maylandia zebra TaxID=106582 RepID=A0A3P9BD42_9CICH
SFITGHKIFISKNVFCPVCPKLHTFDDSLATTTCQYLVTHVRPILGQLTNALSHLGSVGMVHADLKPGNIMVVNRHESPIKVKLIDFGLACPASAVMPGDRVGTVGYCAPEVMLGLPYNEASDMWSLGLVAVELATGVPLYPSENDYDYLKFIIETQGQPPDHVLDSGVYTENYFIGDKYKYIILTRLDDLEQLMMFRRGPEGLWGEKGAIHSLAKSLHCYTYRQPACNTEKIKIRGEKKKTHTTTTTTHCVG